MRIGIVAVVLVVLLASIPVTVSAGDWIKLGSGANSVVFFDVDRDGVSEIVTDSFIMDGLSVLPIQYSIVFKTDYDGDGVLDLVQYVPSTGRIFILKGNGGSEVYTGPVNGSVHVYSGGFQVGSIVFGRGGSVLLPWNVKAAPVYWDRLYAVLVGPGGLVLYDGSGSVPVFPVENGTVLDAGVVDGTLYVLVSSDKSSVVVSYSFASRSPSIRILDIPFDDGFFVHGLFVAVSGSNVFVVRPGSGEPELLGPGYRVIYPVEDTYSFIVLSGSGITEYRVENGSVVPVTVLRGLRAGYADIAGGEAVAVSGGDIYYYGEAVPTVSVKVPPTVYAGSPFKVTVNGSYTEAEVIVEGKRYTLSGPATITVNVSSVGEHEVMVKACKGVYCVPVRKTVIAMPRPLTISVKAPKTVPPYHEFNVSVEIVDRVTGTAPDATCYLEPVGGQPVPLSLPRATVPVFAKPVGLEVVVKVSCNGPLYGSVNRTLQVPVSEYYYAVNYTYEGSGVFRVYAYNKYTGDPFAGKIIVGIDGKKTITVKNGGEFTVSPGRHSVTIVLVSGGVVLGRYKLDVKYYEDISAAPASEKIVVGDRVKYVTRIVNHTATVTVTQPVTIERVNIPVVLGILALGLGLGIVLSYSLPVEWVKRFWKR